MISETFCWQILGNLNEKNAYETFESAFNWKGPTEIQTISLSLYLHIDLGGRKNGKKQMNYLASPFLETVRIANLPLKIEWLDKILRIASECEDIMLIHRWRSLSFVQVSRIIQ